MAKFLTTRGVSYEIENIIKGAKRQLVLISPYVRVPKSLLQNLRDANRRKVKITLVYGKKELEPEAKNQLTQLDNLSLYFLENLHAKCFFNEESMVITSLNLFDSSEQNREMGVLINTTADSGVFEEARKEAKLIIDESKKTGLAMPRSDDNSYRIKQESYCIRCRVAIPTDLEKPLCPDCYSIWAKYKDPDFEEKYCHSCGKPELTTIEKPLCYSCYKKLFG